MPLTLLLQPWLAGLAGLADGRGNCHALVGTVKHRFNSLFSFSGFGLEIPSTLFCILVMYSATVMWEIIEGSYLYKRGLGDFLP